MTTLLLQSIAAAQQRGGILAFVGVDHAFIPDYVRQLGCRVEEIFIAQPDDSPVVLKIVCAGVCVMSAEAPPLPADLLAGLRRLKLATIRAQASEILQTARTQRWAVEDVLRTLVAIEISARDQTNQAAAEGGQPARTQGPRHL